MATAYIVDAVRTAGGKRGGKLAGVHPVDLGAAVFDAIADRNDFDTSKIDDVITGCVSQGGQQTIDGLGARGPRRARGYGACRYGACRFSACGRGAFRHRQ